MDDFTTVCLECGSPLNSREIWVGGVGAGRLEAVTFEHPMRSAAFDHAPILAMAGGEQVEHCDFCQSGRPEHLWVPQQELRLEFAEQVYDYSTAWAACEACSSAVSRGDQEFLFDRHAANAEISECLGEDQKRTLRQLFDGFLATRPVGPHEISKAL